MTHGYVKKLLTELIKEYGLEALACWSHLITLTGRGFCQFLCIWTPDSGVEGFSQLQGWVSDFLIWNKLGVVDETWSTILFCKQIKLTWYIMHVDILLYVNMFIQCQPASSGHKPLKHKFDLKENRNISCGCLLSTILNFRFIFAVSSPDFREAAGNKSHKIANYCQRLLPKFTAGRGIFCVLEHVPTYFGAAQIS